MAVLLQGEGSAPWQLEDVGIPDCSHSFDFCSDFYFALALSRSVSTLIFMFILIPSQGWIMMGLYSQVPVFDRELALGHGLVIPWPHFRDAKQMLSGSFSQNFLWFGVMARAWRPTQTVFGIGKLMIFLSSTVNNVTFWGLSLLNLEAVISCFSWSECFWDIE